jgi:Leucine-rich repeat (LRR) protein
MPILEQLIIRDSVHYAELFNVTINSLQLLQIINNPNFTVFYQNQFNNLTVLDLRNNNISQFCDENLSSLVSLNL